MVTKQQDWWDLERENTELMDDEALRNCLQLQLKRCKAQRDKDCDKEYLQGWGAGQRSRLTMQELKRGIERLEKKLQKWLCNISICYAKTPELKAMREGQMFSIREVLKEVEKLKKEKSVDNNGEN